MCMGTNTIIVLIVMLALSSVGVAEAGVTSSGRDTACFFGSSSDEAHLAITSPDPNAHWEGREPGVPVITSGRDGPHAPTSLHHSGYAIDIGVSNLAPAQAEAMTQSLRAQLGSDYEVICYYLGSPFDHIHVEYDPN